MKLKRAIPIALSIQAAAGPIDVAACDEASVSEEPARKETKGEVASTTDLISRTAAILVSHDNRFIQKMRPSAVTEWTAKKERLFDALVTCEAVGTISTFERKVLDRLQEERRHSLNPASGEEILQRYVREKTDRGMLQLLQRHVQISSLTSYPTQADSSALLYSAS